MVKRIRINEPGAGAWIMREVGGRFVEGYDVSLANYRDGELIGGFVLTGFTHSAMTVHMAGKEPHWCSRELMWMLFNYAFVQLGLSKLLALVKSSNHIALSQDLRAGWRVECVVREVYPDADLFILGMKPDHCRWLKLAPREHAVGALQGAG